MLFNDNLFPENNHFNATIHICNVKILLFHTKSLSNKLYGKYKKTSVYERDFALISDDVVTIRKLEKLYRILLDSN